MTDEHIITLENPIKRGEQMIKQIQIVKPNTGTLRGISLSAIV